MLQKFWRCDSKKFFLQGDLLPIPGLITGNYAFIYNLNLIPNSAMRKYLMLLAGLLFSFLCFSQGGKIAAVLKTPEVKAAYYEMAEAGGWVLYLPMDFGKAGFTYLQEGAIQRLKDANISRIDLVYSDYPAGQDFSSLTKKRLESLYKLFPSLFSDPNIEFRRVRQTIAKTKKTAEGLQHGFFIYFRPKATKEESRREIEKLKESVMPPKETTGGDGSSAVDSLSSIWCGASSVMVDTTGILEDSSFTNWLKIPASVPRIITRWTVKDYMKSGLLPEIKEIDYQDWDSVYHVVYGKDCPTYSSDFFLYQLADTTVSSVFNRHKWNEAIVIADVTGSMYPYTGQLLQWLKLTITDKAKRHFIFFNDGDDKADAAKIIGKTGGIYSVYTNSYDEVEATIQKAMMNGGGGDAPENNIEALIESEKLCNGCDSIVMIADNWAAVKDVSLLARYKKPVKVVLCGVLGSINKDYLKLVRDTKGSLHLIEEDIYNLSELKEGEMIKIHGVNYKLIKGEFVDMASKSI